MGLIGVPFFFCSGAEMDSQILYVIIQQFSPYLAGILNVRAELF
jgi:hypothetical protein